MNPFELCEDCPHPTIEEFVTIHHLVQPQPKERPWFPVPQSRIGRFLFCFVAQMISFFIIASNFRALAKGFYIWTAITDGGCVLQGTILTKLMIENVKMRDGWSLTGFTLGGMCGSLLSIFVTTHIWGS
jgi:hypothetical protein